MTNIYEVAKKAGVSISTVSQVYSRHRYVAKDTVEKVLKAADEMKYVPHRVAQGLATGRKLTIGLHFPFASIYPTYNPYYQELLEGLSSAAAKFGYSFLMLSNESANFESKEILERVDGAIVVDPDSRSQVIDELLTLSKPVVTTGRYMGEGALPWVDNHFAQQVAHLFEHFNEQGYRFPVLLSTEGDVSFLVDVEEAYAEEINKRNLKPWIVRSKGIQEEQDYMSVLQILRHDPLPDVVLALTDYQAAIVLRLANDLGIHVPTQMGVVGFGDTVIARYTHPPLTSVSVESHLIGNSAIELLLNLINGREDIENRYIPSRIVLRSSSVRKAQ